jgi:hypothetical protein
MKSLIREKRWENSFSLIKEKLSTAPILALSNLNKLFKAKCDTYGMRIRGVLFQK